MIPSLVTVRPMPTALITGASSGIGLAYAKALAARGNDLVVVARSEDKLRALADELAVDVEVLPADLTDPEQLGKVEARCGDSVRPIDVLINNAGAGKATKFVEASIDDLAWEHALDVVAPMRLMHAALQVMVPRGSGAILNVASFAAFQPGPGNAVYSASKAFVLSLSEAIHEEVLKAGVHVTVVCPGATRTEFQQRGGFTKGGVPDFMWQEPEEVAEMSLKALDRNAAVLTPGLLNKLVPASIRLTPRIIARKASGFVSARI